MNSKMKMFLAFLIAMSTSLFLFACNTTTDSQQSDSQPSSEIVDSQSTSENVLVTAITVEGESQVELLKTSTYTVAVQPENATNKNVAWSVVNETGAGTIDENGVFTPSKAGTVKIIATAEDEGKVAGELVVTIPENDKLLGIPRPQGGSLQLIATPKNTVFVPNEWHGNDTVEIKKARNVVDIHFTEATSTISASAFLDVPHDLDISKTEYFGIKFKASIEGSDSLKPIVDLQIRDRKSGSLLYLNQVTDLDLGTGNEYGGAPTNDGTIWLVYKIANRYRLTADRDLVVELIPNMIANKKGVTTVIDLCFFGNKPAETQPTYVAGFEAPHWAVDGEGVSVKNLLPDGDGQGLKAAHTEITFNASAVSGWKASPAWIYDNISRFTTVKLRFSTNAVGGGNEQVRFYLYYGDNKELTPLKDAEDQGISISGNALYVKDALMHEVTFKLPADFKESDHFACRAFNIKTPQKPASKDVAVVNIYGFALSGDRDPAPVPATELTGTDTPFYADTRNWVEGGTATDIVENGKKVGVNLAIGGGACKVQFGNGSLKLPNASKMNAFKFKIQGPEGANVFVSKGWNNDWTSDSARSFALTGDVQEITIVADGAIGASYTFEIAIYDGVAGTTGMIRDMMVGVVLPEEAELKEGDLPFSYISATGAGESMAFEYKDGVAKVNVTNNEDKNYVLGFICNGDMMYKNTLKFKVKGPVDGKLNIKVSYGLQYSLGQVKEYTLTGEEQVIEVDIADRSALKANKLSVKIEINGLGEYTISDMAFTAKVG